MPRDHRRIKSFTALPFGVEDAVYGLEPRVREYATLGFAMQPFRGTRA